MSVRVFIASNRRSASKNAFYDLIEFLILSSIEKTFAIIVDEFNTVDELNNVITEISNSEDTFKKLIFTSSSIMLDDNNNYQNTKFIEQQ